MIVYLQHKISFVSCPIVPKFEGARIMKATVVVTGGSHSSIVSYGLQIISNKPAPGVCFASEFISLTRLSVA